MSFKVLHEATPWPSIDSIKPYHFPVDGGGRELVFDIIQSFKEPLMIEIGCFLCGSTTQWLNSSNQLKVIGVDPWPDGDSIRPILERYNDNPVFDPCFSQIEDRDEFIKSATDNGFYRTALANISKYRDRFVPFRGKSPTVLQTLKDEWHIDPHIIYIDANKVSDDLEVSHQLFPDALLCGDDWTWGKDQGFPMRKAVYAFIEKHGFEVEARRATWAIRK